jgi:hypothetical protein
MFPCWSSCSRRRIDVMRFGRRRRNGLRSTEGFKEILDKLSPDEDWVSLSDRHLVKRAADSEERWVGRARIAPLLGHPRPWFVEGPPRMGKGRQMLQGEAGKTIPLIWPVWVNKPRGKVL